MRINELQTPCIVVNLDVIEKNISRYQKACDQYGKELWPMVKTHKCMEIIRMQQAAGAKGFLCGTLEECEALQKAGVQNVMYAYPVASRENIRRVVRLAQSCHFIIRLDDYDGAKLLNAAAEDAGIQISYCIIIDSGLRRFGVAPERAAVFAGALRELRNLSLAGISTHPGNVYSASSAEELDRYAAQEKRAMAIALQTLKEAGCRLEILSSGSTPTHMRAVDDEHIRIFHPGNYVFHDRIQVGIGSATEADCALTVLSTVLSHPADNLFLIDAGSKTLGLDLGGHGNTKIKGYGSVKGRQELHIASLSEEVGKIVVEGKTDVKVGDTVEIIPNHACSTANATSYLIGYRDGTVEKLLKVDMRGNSTRKF